MTVKNLEFLGLPRDLEDYSMTKRNREDAAKAALEDIRRLLASSQADSVSIEPEISNKQLLDLLEKNFSKLDPNNDGISREELITAMTNTDTFTLEECEMLRLLVKYFDTLINLSDDEPGEELRLSRMDFEVLKQFLLYTKFSIAELHMWCSIGDDPNNITGPPPLTSG